MMIQEFRDHLTTHETAQSLGVKPATMIRGLCINGHYFGMVPIKLPNRRLLWSREGRDELIQKAASQQHENA